MAIMRPSAATLRQQFSKMPIAPQVAKMRPRLVRELALLSTREELVVDGTSYLQVIRGKSARDVLPSVMALMDGTRTMPELEAAVPGVPAEQVRATVSLLFNCGMMENGVADSDSSANRQTLDFFRRHLGVTGANRTGKQAYERLQIAEVLILSSGENHERTLQSVLETTGVGRVVQIDPDSLRAWSPASGFTQSLLISFSLGQEDVQRHASLDDWCRERGLAWLRVSLDSAEDIADIGPLFSVAFSPCYRCFQAVHGRPATNAGDFSLPRAEIQFWVSMVAAEVVYLLSKIAPPITGPDFQRYRMKELQASRLPVPRVPGCEKCRPLPEGDRPMHIACVFEDCISVQSLTFAGPKNGAQKPAASTFETKRLPNCQLFPLVREMPKLDRGSLDVLHEQSVRANQPFTLRELSAIFMLTGGLRESARGEDQIKRWSATAGNLGSVELYVLARNVDGLPPGLYFYQPREHALAAFRRRGGALKPTEFMQCLCGKTDDELPDALVLFTGAYHRIGRKYGAFGYKLVNLDAGVALSQMHLAAAALGVYSQTAKLWVDALLEDQLNLDPGQEQSTAVAELYGTAAGTLAPANSLLASTPGAGHAPEKFRNQTVHEIVQTLYAESRRQSFDVRPVPELLVAQWQEGDAVSLPESARGGRLISDSFGRRYSTRSYGYEPVSLSQISTMLHCAHEEDSHAWYEEHAAGLPLDFVVLAWNVEGCEPGVYRYRPEMRALAWLAPAPSKQNAQELFLQPEFAAAPAVIWSFANLAASCARHGAFGHRLLLLRAGAACHRLWMAGLGMGLAGCLVAGVVPGAARRQFGVDGYRQTSLLAFAVGYGAQSAK